MSQRFFLKSPPNSLGPGTTVKLDGDQAHHAINVMRLKPDDSIILFDGSGMEHASKVQTVEKKSISVLIVESVQASKSVQTELTIAVAIPKGDRQKFLVEKLVELGTHRLIPLKTNRSVAVANPKVIERIRKQIVEACKQCGRNSLMEVTESHTIPQLLTLLDEESSQPSSKDIEPNPTSKRLLAHPYEGKSVNEFANESSFTSFIVAVGPEGGFDDSENGLMQKNGFEPMRLGPAILRIETACIATAAILGIGRE